MLYISFVLIIVLFLIIISIVITNQKHKSEYQLKINKLEKIIIELSKNLEFKNQKLKLSDDLKFNMRQSNNELSSKIFDMNLEMFQEMFPKKNL